MNPSAFTLFKCIQSVTYTHLQPMLEGDQPEDNAVIAAAVCSNEHLQFLWATVSLDIATERDSQALLKEMVDLWIKIRGHAMTSMIVELYKRQKAKNTKGAKGIWKQLKLSESYYFSSSCITNCSCVSFAVFVSMVLLPLSCQSLVVVCCCISPPCITNCSCVSFVVFVSMVLLP